MRIIIVTVIIFFFTNLNARTEDNSLQVEKEGLTVIVIDFKEGDKIKLFEVETGDHVLSKTRGQIDLSQLPSGKYLLENNNGKSVIIEKTDEDIVFEKELGTEYLVERDSDYLSTNDLTIEEELEDYYANSDLSFLEIHRDGDVITVVDFKEGDKIKLFEMIDRVHVLSKTTEVVDLTQLAAGRYILENDKGKSVVIEKFEVIEKDEYAMAYN